MSQEYTKTLRFEDFKTLPGFTADKDLLADTWNRIGTYVVVAGEQVYLGRKFDGYAVVIMYDTTPTNLLYGKVRIVGTDPGEYRKVVLLEFNTRTTTDMGDKSKKRLLPLTTPGVGKDGKLILEVYPEAACKIDYGATLSAIDVTVKVVR